MPTHSVEISVPDVHPFDQQASWFESFLGTVIEPVISAGTINRFWFTRYGAVSKGKHALFRFESADVPKVLQTITSELAKCGLSITVESPYDVDGDIGRGQASRFLGTNAKHQSASKRGDLVFTFLHASACLMLDCLAGPDSSGYYSLESETQSGFSRVTSMEQFHHLFCNMTGVPTFVALALPPGSVEPIPISHDTYKRFWGKPGWRFGRLEQVYF